MTVTSDLHLVFGHPLARAEATAGDTLRDRISLRDHVVSVDIGAFQAERGRRQRLRFNIVVEVRSDAAPLADDVDRILSYDRVTEAVALELAAERLNLLETLAERIAARILREPRALRVFIRVEKLDRGPGALGVEIARSRPDTPGWLPGADAATAAPPLLHPVVVHLGNTVIAAPDLSAQLDALLAEGGPVVLCVGLPDAAVPISSAPAAQRRIDLLAIEQNAWVLAGRDRRCLVVASRTEIDWALRQGQMIVWAPSKLVLDAVSGPGASPREPVALSLWLAEVLGADRLLVLGEAVRTFAEQRIRVDWRPQQPCKA